jgi:hypothetical protein
MKTIKKIIVTLTLSTLGFTSLSNAAPIEVWDWAVDSAFTEFSPGTPDVNGDLGSMNTYWNNPSIISWGTSANTLNKISSLDVSSNSNGHVEGTGLANDASTVTSTLVHNNFTISGPTLTSAVLSTKLFLAPAGFGSLDDSLPPLLFSILFKETQNTNNCVYNGIAEMPECRDDIFVVNAFGSDTDNNGTVEQGEFNPFTNSFNQKFSVGGYTYNIGLTIDTLDILHNDICSRVLGASTPCVGITTQEGQANSFGVNMTISLVPEPSTILLMSLAVFGLVSTTRNKHI